MGVDDLIHVPTWDHPDILSAVEDRVDSAVSSANGILDFILAPVRGALRLVLHVIFAFVDLTIGWVYGVVHWVFDRVADLANGARTALSFVLAEAMDYASRLVGDAISFLGGATAGIGHLIDAAIDGVQHLVRGWVDDAIHYASAVADGARHLIAAAIDGVQHLVRGWVDDAIHYASAVADGARHLIAVAVESTLGQARRWVDEAVGTARGLVADVLGVARGLVDAAGRVAQAALDLVVRDLVDPVIHRVEEFISKEWGWAFGLLKIVEDAADWLLWVGSRIVPDVLAVWRFGKSLADDDLGSIIRTGAAIAESVKNDQAA